MVTLVTGAGLVSSTVTRQLVCSSRGYLLSVSGADKPCPWSPASTSLCQQQNTVNCGNHFVAALLWSNNCQHKVSSAQYWAEAGAKYLPVLPIYPVTPSHMGMGSRRDYLNKKKALISLGRKLCMLLVETI